MGGNAIALDLGGNPAIAMAMQGDISYAPFALYENLQVLAGTPAVQILAGITIVLLFVFFVTSADSATLVCAQQTCNGEPNPPRKIKAVWGIVLALVSAMLLCVGGLSSLQTVSIVVAFPFIFVIGALMVSFVRVARNEVNDIDKLKSGEGSNEEPNEKPSDEPNGELTEALSEQTP